MTKFRHPVVTLSHGPRPLWLMTSGYDGLNNKSASAQNVREVFSKIYPSASQPPPKQILFISGHWEASGDKFEISNSPEPDMTYDYYGFTNEAYEFVYPAKGDPAFTQRVADVLQENNIPSKLIDHGYDHGLFAPISLMRPEADIPIVGVSINDRLSLKEHFRLGKALAPFRDEGTLIICSARRRTTCVLSSTPKRRSPLSGLTSSRTGWMRPFQRRRH